MLFMVYIYAMESQKQNVLHENLWIVTNIMIRNSYSEINAFALTGRVDNSLTNPQGVALGYVLLPLRGVPTAPS